MSRHAQDVPSAHGVTDATNAAWTHRLAAPEELENRAGVVAVHV
jgi:hypothetical protein